METESFNWLQTLFTFIGGSAGTLIIKSLLEHFLNKSKNNEEVKSSTIDNNQKTDTYWENRFKGLKVDYEDREQYHAKRYEELKQLYDERLQFQQGLVDKYKSELTEANDVITAKTVLIKELEAQMIEKDKQMASFSQQIIDLSTQIKKTTPEQDMLDK